MRVADVLGLRSRAFWAIVVLGLLAVGGCAWAAEPGADAGGVVQRFIQARGAGNLDATMDCFAESPEMRSSLGVGGTGRDAVRAIMAARLANAYTVGDLRVEGNQVVWSEHVRRNVWGAPVANFDEDVVATVVGGRISSLVTYVGGAHPPTVAAPKLVSLSTDVLVPLGTLLLVAAAVLAWPQTPPLQPRRTTTGHLLAGLRDYVARRG